MKKVYPPGAGMIVCRDFGQVGTRILLLKLHNNTWDLPKGRLDAGETMFDCAVRETFEESNISNVSFPWGHICINLENLTFYICSTNDDPKIFPNPVYQIYEHESAWWVDPNKALILIPEYLKPAIMWAIDVLSQ